MIVIVPSSLPTISEYYRTYSTDAAWTGDLVFQPQSVVSAPIASFVDLLGVMSRYVDRGERKFLIVSHGSRDELYLPIAAGSRFPSDFRILNMLADCARGNSGARQSLLSGDWEVDGRKVKAFADGGQLDKAVSLVRKMQGANLSEVHFRACSVGAGNALGALSSVLGASHTSGPTSWFVYYWRSTATLPARTTSAASLAEFSRMPSPLRVYTRDECLLPFDSNHSGDEPALALNTAYGGDQKPNISKVQAISQVAIQGWTRSFLEDSQFYASGAQAPGGGYRLGHKLIVFGVSNEGAPDNPVLFPGDGMDYLNKLAVANR